MTRGSFGALHLAAARPQKRALLAVEMLELHATGDVRTSVDHTNSLEIIACDFCGLFAFPVLVASNSLFFVIAHGYEPPPPDRILRGFAFTASGSLFVLPSLCPRRFRALLNAAHFSATMLCIAQHWFVRPYLACSQQHGNAQ